MAKNRNLHQAKALKLSGESLDPAAIRRGELKQLFPAAFTETVDENGEPTVAVDFERLKAELGEFSEIYDRHRERYGMEWPGKGDCLKTIQEQSRATLKPCREESVAFDQTENLFIEGDNLEALKLLQKSYHGQIKMIYIDPPYNTGKEFIYPDKYADSLENYLEYAGMRDEEGRRVETRVNSRDEGRFHTKWLNMMYPRLYLARNLLRDDGVIFISIDDNEVANLRKVCDEVFGEENFVADLIWEKRFTRNNDAKLMSSVIDHIILYRKSEACFQLREPRTEKSDSIYNNPDNDHRGPWTSVSYVSQRTKEQRPNLSYAIRNPITGVDVVHEVNAWKYSQEQCKKHLLENRLYWGKEGNNSYPRLKRFLSELGDGIVPVNLWDYKQTGTIDDGTKIVDKLLGKDIFDYPKPPSLLRRMMSMALNKDDIVLDFFSGSCTTAHAVLDLNKEDGGNRKFIMVQLPEPCDEKSEAAKAGYGTIAEIGKERIRRVIKRIEAEQAEKAKAAEGELDLESGEDEGRPLDLGFRVLKLDKSNFKAWQPLSADATEEEIKRALQGHLFHIDERATAEDILFEILLKAGFMPSTRIETLELAGKTVYSVAEGELFICLEDAITRDLIDAVVGERPRQFICLDRGFRGNDQLKANTVQTFNALNESKEKGEKVVFRTV